MALLHDPTLWTLVAMLVLFAFLGTRGRPVLRMIRDGLDHKIDAIRQSLNKAQHDMAVAKASLIKVKDQWSSTIMLAGEIRMNAENEAKLILEDSRRNLDRLVRARHNAAQERLRYEEQKALKEIRAFIAERVINEIRQRIENNHTDDSSVWNDVDTLVQRLPLSQKDNTEPSEMALDHNWRTP